MDLLLDELVVYILMFCDVSTLCRVRLCCQRLKRLATDDLVWEKHMEEVPSVPGIGDYTDLLDEQKVKVDGGKNMMLYKVKKEIGYYTSLGYSTLSY